MLSYRLETGGLFTMQQKLPWLTVVELTAEESGAQSFHEHWGSLRLLQGTAGVPTFYVCF